MEKKTETRVGLGFAEALTLLFIALRLCGVIDWPWLWVLAPLWGHLVIFGFFLSGYALWARWKDGRYPF